MYFFIPFNVFLMSIYSCTCIELKLLSKYLPRDGSAMLLNVLDEMVGKSSSCDNTEPSSLRFLVASPRTDRHIYQFTSYMLWVEKISRS